MNYSNLNDAYEFFENSVNINDKPLQLCGTEPMTGFYRNGYCKTGPEDTGTHTVCAKMTNEFLNYTKSMGNDLSTPRNGFPGLKEGDKWCLCAMRWQQAHDAGNAPNVISNATNKKSYDLIPEIDPKYFL